MKHLLRSLPDLLARLRGAPRVLLFLDYDGTLVPLERAPVMATLPPRTRFLLQRLSASPWILPCIVTGRSLTDIRRKVGLPTLPYIANHGLEMEAGGRRWVHEEAERRRPLLEELTATLRRSTASLRGVAIEEKGLTLSAHYRRATGDAARRLRRLLRQAVTPYGEALTIRQGKKVAEIRPAIDWDKGRAILAFAACRQWPKIYIGDDRTDEDAFAILGEGDVGVRVGYRASSRAHYYLKSPRAVLLVLERLADPPPRWALQGPLP